MSADGMRGLLSRVRSLGPDARRYVHRGEPTPFPLSCRVEPALAWDQSVLEESLGGRLPDDLRQLWQEASGLRMFEDAEYGQWGLVLWSPNVAAERTAAERSGRPTEFIAGDLVVGEFLGDAERVLVRCSPTEPDFGQVYVALPLDPRSEWESPASCLAEFLVRFLDSQGDKFWELAASR